MGFQVDFADGEDAFHRGFVAEFTAERVAGVGGVHDDSAAADDVGGLFDQAFLRVVGVDGEELCHGGFPFGSLCCGYFKTDALK